MTKYIIPYCYVMEEAQFVEKTEISIRSNFRLMYYNFVVWQRIFASGNVILQHSQTLIAFMQGAECKYGQ